MLFKITSCSYNLKREDKIHRMALIRSATQADVFSLCTLFFQTLCNFLLISDHEIIPSYSIPTSGVLLTQQIF